jgi:hypothetical protein
MATVSERNQGSKKPATTQTELPIIIIIFVLSEPGSAILFFVTVRLLIFISFETCLLAIVPDFGSMAKKLEFLNILEKGFRPFVGKRRDWTETLTWGGRCDNRNPSKNQLPFFF